jgi:hypothetical protein
MSTIGLLDINTKERAMTSMQPAMRRDLLTAIIDGGNSVPKVEIQEVAMNTEIDAPLHLHQCPAVGVITEGQIAFEIEGKQTQHQSR